MKPYRDLFPHAGLMLPESIKLASRVVVLPNGGALTDDAIDTIASVCRALSIG